MSATAVAPRFLVTDAQGNPVTGAVVSFSTSGPSGDGRVNGQPTVMVATGDDGTVQLTYAELIGTTLGVLYDPADGP